MSDDVQHADPMFDAERAARAGIRRLAEYLESDEQSTKDAGLEKARIGHKALTAYASLRGTRQREVTGAVALGRALSLPASEMAHNYEALTGRSVAHLLPDDRERSSGEDESPKPSD